MEGRRGSVTAMDGRGRRRGRGGRGDARFAGTAAMDAAAMDGKNHGIKSCLRDLGSNFPCAGAAAAIGGGGCGRGEEEADGSHGAAAGCARGAAVGVCGEAVGCGAARLRDARLGRLQAYAGCGRGRTCAMRWLDAYTTNIISSRDIPF
jgi:hypothetical protein